MARGTVSSFDAERGIGEIETAEGDHLPFHCTAITDRTRSIDLGCSVEFSLVPGHRGHWEAASVTPI